jgi:hypothetical protein
VLAYDTRINLAAREESQKDRTEARKEVDPVRDLQRNQVARNGSHHDLDESDGYCNAN